MLKENKKMKSTMIKEERQRIMNLINMAYKNDPRIREFEEKIRIKKEKEKQERFEQKLKEQKEEEERQLKLKIEREEQIRRKQEELQREKINLQQSIKDIMSENNLILTEEQLFQVQLNAKIESLRTVVQELEACGKDNSEKVIKTFKNLASNHFAIKFQDESNDSTLWNKEEIVSLQKAVKKFPAGTKNRWEKISELIKSKPTNQIIQFAHILATNPNIKFDEEPIVRIY
jgi:hypothetical protein